MAIDVGVDGRRGVWETRAKRRARDRRGARAAPPTRNRRQRKAAQEPEGISEGARLLALQQLMAGVDADVIATRLEKEFGVENPRAILEWMGLQVQPEDSSKKP